MKIISHLHGALLRLVSNDEITPLGASSVGAFANVLQARYQFKNIGESLVAQGLGLNNPAFQNGTFLYNGNEVPIIGLDFQGSKIQLVCTRTDQAIAAMDDVLNFLQKEFSFRYPQRSFVDLVSSAVVCDGGPHFLEKVTNASQVLSSLMRALGKDGLAATFSPSSVRFSGKTDSRSQMEMTVNYVLEERANRPAGTHWVFSNAPLSSSSHEEMLMSLAQDIGLTSDADH